MKLNQLFSGRHNVTKQTDFHRGITGRFILASLVVMLCSAFTLATQNTTKNWDGTLQYSTNGTTYYLYKDDTGISQTFENAALVLYPNPARDFVTVSGLNGQENAKTLQVYDLFGRMVLSQKLSGTATTTINVSALATGFYQVRIGEQIEKLIVE